MTTKTTVAPVLDSDIAYELISQGYVKVNPASYVRRVAGRVIARVQLDDNIVTVYHFVAGGMDWSSSFTDGTPITVVVYAAEVARNVEN